jgi:hypothetical protein
MARHRCRTSMNRPDIVDCGQKISEQVKKTTSVTETKNKK